MPTTRVLRNVVCPHCGHLTLEMEVIVPDPPPTKPGMATAPKPQQVEVKCPKCRGKFMVTLR